VPALFKNHYKLNPINDHLYTQVQSVDVEHVHFLICTVHSILEPVISYRLPSHFLNLYAMISSIHTHPETKLPPVTIVSSSATAVRIPAPALSPVVIVSLLIDGNPLLPVVPLVPVPALGFP
jgi:hypothetical protein